MHSVGSTADGQSVQCQYGPGMPLMNGAYILYGPFPLCVSSVWVGVGVGAWVLLVSNAQYYVTLCIISPCLTMYSIGCTKERVRKSASALSKWLLAVVCAYACICM